MGGNGEVGVGWVWFGRGELEWSGTCWFGMGWDVLVWSGVGRSELFGLGWG